MQQQIVAYHRVSTREQGHFGLGMDAQRAAVAAFAASTHGVIIASYSEVESARRDSLRNRPELVRALAHARRCKATLVIARLDRLARSVLVTSKLLASGVDFVACDNPHANRFTIHVLAALAEHESRTTSERVKAAFAVARARGASFRRPGQAFPPEAARLGSLAANAAAMQRSREIYADLVPIVEALRKADMSLRQVARELNAMGHRTQRGTPWQVGTIYAFCKREAISSAPASWWVGQNAYRVEQSIETEARTRDVVNIIMRERLAGKTFAVIAGALNASGSATPRGCPWNAASINNLLCRRGANHRGDGVRN